MSLSGTGIPFRKSRPFSPYKYCGHNNNSSGRVLCRATTGVGEAGGGKGHNGGVFEWTSSLFEKHEGFLQSILYPGYVLLSALYSYILEIYDY